MKVEISVPEAVSLFKEIQQQPEKLFEMIRGDIRDSVGQYLSRLMGRKLSATEVSNANKEMIEAVEQWGSRDLSRESMEIIFSRAAESVRVQRDNIGCPFLYNPESFESRDLI